MSYRCGICNDVVPRGVPRRTHVIERRVKIGPFRDGTRSEIAAEIPVCAECDRQLRAGTPLLLLRQIQGMPVRTTAPEPPAPALIVPKPGAPQRVSLGRSL